MSRFFWMRADKTGTASYDARHKWRLPGVRCHTCGATWASPAHHHPAVDLSQLPERREFEQARPEPFPEFASLRELVRPLAPPNAALPPGTNFGPLVGTASGQFGSFMSQGDILWLVRPDALEQLQRAGLRGLLGCRVELQFRQKDPPELLELQIEPHGKLHSDCIPPDEPPPCPTCGRQGFGRPDEPILDAASLPRELDLFRVGNFATMVIGSERFMEAVRRLELDGIRFQELPAR